MKIEVNYNELYNLGDYMQNMFEELKKDFEEINVISESLNSVLQGSAEQNISARIKNFNTTQFSQIVNYTSLLGSEVTNCAKLYNAEDDEFAQKMKKEAAKYGLVDGSIISDARRYQTQTSSSGYISSTPSTQSNANTSNTTGIENITSGSTINETTPSNINSQNDYFDDIIIEEVESDTINVPNTTFEASAQENYNSSDARLNESAPKTKGMFGGIFGAAAAAMGLKFASNKNENKEENTNK